MRDLELISLLLRDRREIGKPVQTSATLVISQSIDNPWFNAHLIGPLWVSTMASRSGDLFGKSTKEVHAAGEQTGREAAKVASKQERRVSQRLEV